MKDEIKERKNTKRRKSEEVIAALLETPTIKAAAERAGIGEATIYRWLDDPEFEREYRRARRQAVQQAITRLQQLSGEAVETLREIMTDKAASDQARLRAAKTILDGAVDAVELEEIEERIKTLEKTLNER